MDSSSNPNPRAIWQQALNSLVTTIRGTPPNTAAQVVELREMVQTSIYDIDKIILDIFNIPTGDEQEEPSRDINSVAVSVTNEKNNQNTSASLSLLEVPTASANSQDAFAHLEDWIELFQGDRNLEVLEALLIDISPDFKGYTLLKSIDTTLKGDFSVVSMDDTGIICIDKRNSHSSKIKIDPNVNPNTYDKQYDLTGIRNELQRFLNGIPPAEEDSVWRTPVYTVNLDAASKTDRARFHLATESVLDNIVKNCKLNDCPEQIPGIHQAQFFISSGFGTIFAAHEEDFNLAALNYLIAGTPKIWFVIYAEDHKKFEEVVIRLKNVEKHPKMKQLCEQFVRHEDIFVPENILQKEGIRYKLIKQAPGQIVMTWPGCYHYGINTGPNIAEAINFAFKSWDPTCDGGVECQKGKCISVEPLTKRQFCATNTGDNKKRKSRSGTENNQDQDTSSKNKNPRNLPKRAKVNSSGLTQRSSNISTLTDSDDIEEGSQDGSQGGSDSRPRVNPEQIQQQPGTSQLVVPIMIRDWVLQWKKKPSKKDRSHESIASIVNDILAAKNQAIAKYKQDNPKATKDLNIDCLEILKMLFCFGSVECLEPIQVFLKQMRSKVEWSNTQQADTNFNVIKALENLKDIGSMTGISHRIYVMKLVSIMDQECDRIRAEVKKSEKHHKEIAWKKLITEAYPSINDEDRRKKANYLQSEYAVGVKWNTMVSNGKGILLLLPTGGYYKMSNRSFKRLSTCEFEIFFTSFVKYRSGFVQRMTSKFNTYIEQAFDGKLLDEKEHPKLVIETLPSNFDFLKLKDESDEVLKLLDVAK